MSSTSLIVIGASPLIEQVRSLPAHVVEGDPLTDVRRYFVHPEGKMHAGLWECGAGSFAIPAHASTEFCVILEGSVVVEDAGGVRREFRAGDSFIVPEGLKSIWHVSDHVKKAYVCVFGLNDR